VLSRHAKAIEAACENSNERGGVPEKLETSDYLMREGISTRAKYFWAVLSGDFAGSAGWRNKAAQPARIGKGAQ